MPFMSRPSGGKPPDSVDVKLRGTKPSGKDAAPATMPIWDVFGIERI
jgi:hypothetical protein